MMEESSRKGVAVAGICFLVMTVPLLPLVYFGAVLSGGGGGAVFLGFLIYAAVVGGACALLGRGIARGRWRLILAAVMSLVAIVVSLVCLMAFVNTP